MTDKVENKNKSIEEQLAELIEKTRMQNKTLKKMIDQIERKHTTLKTNKLIRKEEK